MGLVFLAYLESDLQWNVNLELAIIQQEFLLDYNMLVSEFKLQSHYHVHIQTNTPNKDMNSLSFP